MKKASVKSARAFVQGVTVPPPRRARGPLAARATEAAFDSARNQAAVVGSDVIAFVQGVTPERRQAIVNASLLAQLVAKTKVGDASKVYDWYETYFDVLTNIGWVVQDRSFAEYHEGGKNFEAHKAIVSVATALLGAAPAALALVKTTLDALQSMDADSPWITVFDRESRHARTARFQISLAEQDAGGQFFVTLMAFGLEATARVTQVLFFKARASEATLRHYSGRVTINTAVLESVQEAIAAKLTGHAADFVRKLPDIDAPAPATLAG